MPVKVRREGPIGYVELDNPPVNAMSQSLRQGLLDAVTWAEAETGLERVIVTGRGRAFAAGGDAREFDAPPLEPHLPDVLNRIEACRVPWIAAAHGVALGGGAELMLACRYRIAAAGTQVGLPEVSLGIVPGAGGTQRLPRLVGLRPALEMISSGKALTAEGAEDIGLLDAIAEDPLAAAAAADLETILRRPRVSEMAPPQDDPDAVEAIRQTVARRMRGQIAPQRAIELVAAATRTPFAEALAQERAAFLTLRNSDQARALRHIFFAERAARTPAWLQDTAPKDLSEAVVVGGGNMGAAIAYALLSVGIRVVLVENDEAGVARATGNVERIVTASVKRGLLSENQAEERRSMLRVVSDYAPGRNADLAIEAAFESMEVKKSVFESLQAALPAKAVLATNTSYLDLNEIASVLSDPSRLVGLHFFAPAHIMRLLEIVRGDATSPVALATGFDLAKQVRKIPVLAGVCDGFIGNRILSRYREAADSLLLEGATPWQVDDAMVAFGYAMGPYEAQDLSGLDIACANRKRQAATRDPKRRYVAISDRMVEEGRLGKKAGIGWYRYPDSGDKAVDPLVEDLIREEARLAEIARREFSPDEVRRRLLLAMINEAADVLSEGIAQSAADIDLVMVFGYGFPRWRGGLMHYADQLGAATIFTALKELSAEDAIVWKPSPVIQRCAEAGVPFAQFAESFG